MMLADRDKTLPLPWFLENFATVKSASRNGYGT